MVHSSWDIICVVVRQKNKIALFTFRLSFRTPDSPTLHSGSVPARLSLDPPLT